MKVGWLRSRTAHARNRYAQFDDNHRLKTTIIEMKISILTILMFLKLVAAGQAETVFSGNGQIVYAELPNYITIINCNHVTKELILITDNGIIKSDYPKSTFNWIPEHPGIGTIKVFILSGKDSIFLASHKFQIEKLSSFFKFQLWSAKNGKISLDSLNLIKMAYTDYCYFFPTDIRTPTITEFSILVIRDNQQIFNIQNVGQEFSENTKGVFKKLVPTDILVFYSIKYLYFGKTGKLEPVEFRITI